jgi:hypothetical protein
VLITDRLVYVQLQKTASTRIAEILQGAVGGELVRPKHGPVDERAGDRFVVGSVRDPWAYYLSLWSFGCRSGGGLFERLTGVPRGDRQPGDQSALSDHIRPKAERSRRGRRRARRWAAAYSSDADPACFRAWLRAILDPTRAQELGEGFAASSMSAHAGIYSYRYCLLHVANSRMGSAHPQAGHSDALLEWVERDCLLDGSIRIEHMADDMLQVLSRAGYQLTADQRSRVREEAGTRSNQTGGGDKAAHFYNRRARDLVSERDRMIIERHRYQPPEC